jgi:hypothetical protein
LVVLNTATNSQLLPAGLVGYPAGTKLVNLLGEDETLAVGDDGQMPSVVVAGTSAKMFLPESQIRPLDPVVTAISPAHDAKGIRPTAPVVIHFSQPMDVASGERAFSTAPSVAGTFSWSSAHDAMTFIPAAGGFPPQMIQVRIGSTARAARSGKPFYAGFEARFDCENAN